MRIPALGCQIFHPGDEESSDSDEESSVGMPDLIDRHDDSSKEDTIQDSIGSPELGSVTESATTAIEDSSVACGSDGTNESPVIQIENLEMVEEAVPERRACLTYVMHGHTTPACTDRKPKEASETPKQGIDYRLVMVNELRWLGIDVLAGLNEESSKGEAPELGLMSQQSFPINSLSLLRDPTIFIGDTGATADVTHDKTGCIN